MEQILPAGSSTHVAAAPPHGYLVPLFTARTQWDTVRLEGIAAREALLQRGTLARRQARRIETQLSKVIEDSERERAREQQQREAALTRSGRTLCRAVHNAWVRSERAYAAGCVVEMEHDAAVKGERRQEKFLRDSQALGAQLAASLRRLQARTTTTPEGTAEAAEGTEGSSGPTAEYETKLTLLNTLNGKRPLRPYQRTALTFLLNLFENGLNGILADEMGLGKTVQTLALFAHFAEHRGDWGPHLVVVPSSLVANWELECLRWVPGFRVVKYMGTAKERAVQRRGWTQEGTVDIVVTSYNTVLQDRNIFLRKIWGFLVLDEAHQIRNWESKRWQTLFDVQSQHRLLLTGTPLQTSVMELWALLRFIVPQRQVVSANDAHKGGSDLSSALRALMAFQNNADFQRWFSDPLSAMVAGRSGFNEAVVSRLHSLLRPFFFRRLKADVAQDLPTKTEVVVNCPLSRRQRALYNDFMMLRETRATLAGGSYLGVMRILLLLRKVCDHPDLFAERPIASPFNMNALPVDVNCNEQRITLRVPRLVLTRWADRVGRAESAEAADVVHVRFGTAFGVPMRLRLLDLGLSITRGGAVSPLALFVDDVYHNPHATVPVTGAGGGARGGSRGRGGKSSGRAAVTKDAAAPLPPASDPQQSPLLFAAHAAAPTLLANTAAYAAAHAAGGGYATERAKVLFTASERREAVAAFGFSHLRACLMLRHTSTTGGSNLDWIRPRVSESAAASARSHSRTPPRARTRSRSPQAAQVGVRRSGFMAESACPETALPTLATQCFYFAPEARWAMFEPTIAAFLCVPPRVYARAPLMQCATDARTPWRLAAGQADADIATGVGRTLPLAVDAATASTAAGPHTAGADEVLIDRHGCMFVHGASPHGPTAATSAEAGRAATLVAHAAYEAVIPQCVASDPMHCALPQGHNNGLFHDPCADPDAVALAIVQTRGGVLYQASKGTSTVSASQRHHERRRWLGWRTAAANWPEPVGIGSALSTKVHSTKRPVGSKAAAAAAAATSKRGAAPEPVGAKGDGTIHTHADTYARRPPRAPATDVRTATRAFRADLAHDAVTRRDETATEAALWRQEQQRLWGATGAWPLQVQFVAPDRRLVLHDCGKLQVLNPLCRRLHQEGHRVLIFTQFTAMLSILEKFMALLGLAYLRLDGSTRPDDRQLAVERFNREDTIFAMLLSTRSGGIGLNLIGADTVIFYDSDWNPAMDLQAQDRCHRIGQTRAVTIYRLVSEHTVEASIVRKARERKTLNNLVIRAGQFHLQMENPDAAAAEPGVSGVGESEGQPAAAGAAEAAFAGGPTTREALMRYFHDYDEDYIVQATATRAEAASVGSTLAAQAQGADAKTAEGEAEGGAEDWQRATALVEDAEDSAAARTLQAEARQMQDMDAEMGGAGPGGEGAQSPDGKVDGTFGIGGPAESDADVAHGFVYGPAASTCERWPPVLQLGLTTSATPVTATSAPAAIAAGTSVDQTSLLIERVRRERRLTVATDVEAWGAGLLPFIHRHRTARLAEQARTRFEQTAK